MFPAPGLSFFVRLRRGARLIGGRAFWWLGLLTGVWLRASAANLGTNGEFIVHSWTSTQGAPLGPIVALAQTSDGYLWVASPTGLGRFDGAVFRSMDSGFIATHGALRQLTADAEGALWMVTVSNQLARVEEQRRHWLGSAQGVPAVGIHGVYPDGNGGVVASDFAGSVHAIRKRRLALWIDSMKDPPGPFVGINTDFNGGVWVRHGFILSWWSGSSWERLRARGDGDLPPALKTAARHQGGMWISTGAGIGVFTDGFLEPNRLRYPEPIPGVQAMMEDRRGNVWVAVGGDGLVRFDRHGRYHGMSGNSGLPVDAVRSLFEDIEGTVWVGTASAGLFSLRTVAESTLQSLRPATLPRVSLVAIRGDGRAIDLATTTGQIPLTHTLPAGTRVLEFEFDAARLGNPQSLRFRHQLLGCDPGWVNGGSGRLATYTNLPAGRYEFRVAAGLDAPESWGDSTSPLVFILPPQWWQSWLFRGVLVGSLAGLGAAAYSWRITALKRAQEAQRSLAQQLLTSQEAERQRIASELHDSLGQQLLVIKNSVQLALESPLTDDTAVEHLEMVSRMATQCLDEIRLLARNLHPYQLDQMGLTKALRALAAQVAQSASLTVHADLDDLEDALPKGAEISLYRIIQEGLSNVVKHAGASTVWLTVERNGREVSFQLRDDGCGFDVSNSPAGGFGLSSVGERVAMLAGTLAVTSRPGGGTTLAVCIPTAASSHED